MTDRSLNLITDYIENSDEPILFSDDFLNSDELMEYSGELYNELMCNFFFID